MTKDTPPYVATVWEPITEGINLFLDKKTFKLPMSSVRELRNDMDEALWLSRGYEPVECLVKEVQQGDRFTVVTKDFVVASVLEEKNEFWIMQTRDGCEVRLYGDELIVVWRPVQ